MLNLFKKQDNVVVPPIVGTPKTFEAGKEVTFRDEKTGEFVYQRSITADQRQECFQNMQENGMLANQFIAMNRQRMAMEIQIDNVNNQINASEKKINEAIEKIRDDMKLDRRWNLNMNLGVLERRDPPTGV